MHRAKTRGRAALRRPLAEGRVDRRLDRSLLEPPFGETWLNDHLHEQLSYRRPRRREELLQRRYLARVIGLFVAPLDIPKRLLDETFAYFLALDEATGELRQPLERAVDIGAGELTRGVDRQT